MDIRYANNADSQEIYNLHIDSIKYYCSDFYPKASINAWLELKSPEEYQSVLPNRILIVAEENNEITGFCLLNIYKKSIDSLYIKPKMAGEGIGTLLLTSIEEMAEHHNIEMLTLSSTMNSIGFYHRMGYVGDAKSFHRLSSGVDLECVEMTKNIASRKIGRAG